MTAAKAAPPSLSRRQFCACTAALAAGALGCPSQHSGLPGNPPSQLTIQTHGSGLSQVVEARWAAAVDPYGVVNATRVAEMLGRALQTLTGSSAPFGAWAGPQLKHSIKVNSIDCQAFTHPELARALAIGLVEHGAEPGNVTVWDRHSEGLRRRGYTLDHTGTSIGYRCLGSDASTTQGTPVVAGGARVHLLHELAGSDLHFNLAALKDHSMAGVSLSLKNNFGAIMGAELLHGDFRRGSGCEPGISDLAALPEVRDRTQLAVVDGLIGVCEGGPGPADAQHVFRYGGILVSRDPVALDRRGAAIIEARRKELGLVPLEQRTSPNPSPLHHINNSADKGVSPT